MENTNENEIKTWDVDDLWLAAFLLTNHVKLTKVEKKRDSQFRERTIFIFENSPELKDFLIEYVNDGYVRVKSYKSAVFECRILTKKERREEKEDGNQRNYISNKF